MKMRPIVDRLQPEFEGEIVFVYANAADRATGQSAFELLQLLGHPAVVIFRPDGSEAYRGFGILKEETLREAILNVLSP